MWCLAGCDAFHFTAMAMFAKLLVLINRVFEIICLHIYSICEIAYPSALIDMADCGL